MKVFQEFGNVIESRWRDANYDEHAFPSIARQGPHKLVAGLQ